MDIEKIINNPEKLLIENYFELQKEAEKKYGKNTLVFIEIGSFYEIYQYDNIGKARELSKILNIILTKKNKNNKEVNIKNPYLCGIPTVSLEKNLQKIISENKWTILLINQEGRPPKIKRYLEKIISPGTNIDYLNNEENSFIASVYIEKNKNNIYSGGLTLIEPTIGKVMIYEHHGLSNDQNIMIDEVNQIISNYNISEIIITAEKNFDYSIIKTKNNIIKRTIEENTKSFEIHYQNELFKYCFNTNSELSPIEELDLERMPFTSNSLSILLEFIIEHNKLIVKNLKKPTVIYSNKYMYLGNNPIAQLDIFHKDTISVIDIVNNGITSIGRRYIKEQLFNPIIDKNEIIKRYENSKKFIKDNKKTINELKNIYDIERIYRKIEIETIQPYELSNLINSLISIKNIKRIEKKENKKLDLFLNNIFQIFDIEKMTTLNIKTIDTNFIKNGYSKEIDELTKEINKINNEKIEILNNINENFTMKESDEGIYLEITKTKLKELKEPLNQYSIIKTKNLKNSTKFFIKELSDIEEKELIIKTRLYKKVKEIYESEIKKIKKDYSSLIKEEINFICEIEFYINNAKLYKEKAYCIPEIIDSDENHYEAEELRHPIVETIEKEIFIPNNMQFGIKKNMKLNTDILFNEDKTNGYLLYGQNSSGKTVLSKSIGISIILAQSGFFVPAKSLNYSIYKSLFTRILGSDNMSRGLSTFAVEMIELKNILNRATKKSLIIGDEISHGTETISGLSIVAATVLSLKEKDCNFIIATHLHQLTDIEEIRELKTINPIHLEMIYNEKEDKVIYNRKIQKGKGSSIYGLEYAKSIKLPQSFLEKAYSIRKEIANDLKGLEELIKKRKSKYNSKVYIGVCSECGEKAEEVHHINEQKEANENGLINHFHKNNKANLKPLCKKCHIKLHKGEEKLI